MGQEVVIVTLSERLLRRVHDRVESGETSCRSIQDFIALALENQLSLPPRELGDFLLHCVEVINTIDLPKAVPRVAPHSRPIENSTLL